MRVGYYNDDILYKTIRGSINEFRVGKYWGSTQASRLIYLNPEQMNRLMKETHIPSRELEEIAEIESSNKKLLYETLEAEKVV